MKHRKYKPVKSTVGPAHNGTMLDRYLEIFVTNNNLSEVHRIVTEQGANVRRNNSEVLILAAGLNYHKMITLLVELGADFDARAEEMLKIAQRMGYKRLEDKLQKMVDERNVGKL